MKHKPQKVHHISTFDLVNTILVLIITLITIYPLYFCIIASFSDPKQVALGNTVFWIRNFTLESYQYVLREQQLWVGYRNSILYMLLGTLYNLALTIPAAYVLTKSYLPFRNILSWFFFITMYFSGGMIPTYLLYKDLGLIDSPLALILGAGVSCYNLIVTRQYFSTSIPQDIYDAAYIDGASEWKCFIRIAMPLAKPITAVMALYYGWICQGVNLKMKMDRPRSVLGHYHEKGSSNIGSFLLENKLQTAAIQGFYHKIKGGYRRRKKSFYRGKDECRFRKP